MSLVNSDLDILRRQIITRICDIIIIIIIIITCDNDLSILLFVLHVFDMSPLHCPLLLVFVCCAVSVLSHLAVYSAR